MLQFKVDAAVNRYLTYRPTSLVLGLYHYANRVSVPHWHSVLWIFFALRRHTSGKGFLEAKERGPRHEEMQVGERFLQDVACWLA